MQPRNPRRRRRASTVLYGVMVGALVLGTLFLGLGPAGVLRSGEIGEDGENGKGPRRTQLVRSGVRTVGALSPTAKHPSILVGILTHNRREYVEQQAASLREFARVEPGWRDKGLEFIILDDASTEFSYEELLQWYPMASMVHDMLDLLEVEGIGNRANVATRMLLNYFERKTRCDWVVIADSDLVFHPLWHSRLLALIEAVVERDRHVLLTLYNSCMHEDIACNAHACSKRDIGNAGAVWPRRMVKAINEAIPEKVGGNAAFADFDWHFSRYLADNDVQMLALRPSMVEHMGGKGSNNEASSAEVSADFPIADLPEQLRQGVRSNMGARRQCRADKLAALSGL